MIDYGAAPAADEIEITVFGPGFGEAIAVHLGAANWILVDSCIEPESKLPASQAYLDQIGVPPANVKAIVASHWHDDHVRGMSGLAAFYSDAEFVMSTAFNDAEAMAFLSAHSKVTAPELARGTSELHKVIGQRDSVFFAGHRSILFDVNASGRQVRVVALSPLPAAFAQSIAHFAKYVPSKSGGSPVNHAPELRPNLEAVAIHIDFDGDAALLGSDLEEHHRYGWSAIVANQWCASRRHGSAYKVAHHGSHTGEHAQIWTTLLARDPTVCMTPFNLGNVKLPTDQDKVRIKGQARDAYISSGATRRPDMDSAILKRLNDVCSKVTRVNSGFGAVRLRKTRGAQTWSAQLFGNASAL